MRNPKSDTYFAAAAILGGLLVNETLTDAIIEARIRQAINIAIDLAVKINERDTD